MKTRLLALVLMAGGAAMAGPRVFFGFGFGAPAPVPVYVAPPAPVVTAYVPPAPGPGYTWIGGLLRPGWTPLGLARRILGAAAFIPAHASLRLAITADGSTAAIGAGSVSSL